MKTKYPAELAWDVAAELRMAFEGNADRLVFAGSLRRRRREVGDLEIIMIPRLGEEPDPADMFGGKRAVEITTKCIDGLVERGTLTKRQKVDGTVTWGAKNKLAVHASSGLPVDIFITDLASWFNYLVCRTGGAETNKAICNAAITRGLKWCPYSPGFVKGRGEWDTSDTRTRITVRSEQEVFSNAGLPYRKPWERD